MKESTIYNKIADIFGSQSHFYLLEGQREILATEIEEYFSQNSSCSFFKIEGAEFKADHARELVAELLKKSFELDIFLFYDFEQIDPIAQNILLKSLEELGENKIIIAICNSVSGILDTIVSRAYHEFFQERTDSDEVELGRAFEKKSDKLKYYFELLEQKEPSQWYQTLSDADTLKNILDQTKANQLILKYAKSIEANVNKDLCTDLLIYKLLEE